MVINTNNETDVESVKEFVQNLLDDHFKKHSLKKRPSLEPFEPEEDTFFSSLYKQSHSSHSVETSTDDDDSSASSDSNTPTIPSLPSNENKNIPSLLLYDLLNEDAVKGTNVYSFIEKNKNSGVTQLYGTSGAGKTRSIFEYLSHNKGIYLIAAISKNIPGSQDLDFVTNLHGPAAPLGNTSDTDYGYVFRQRLGVLLHIRKAVHDMVTKLLGNITAHEWLLFQLFPVVFLGEDVFHSITLRACQHMETNNLSIPVDLPEWGTIFVDEGQQVLKNISNFFGCDRKGAKRSLFGAIREAFDDLHTNHSVGWPVFASTGLSKEEFKSKMAGETQKDHQDVFIDFKKFSKRDVKDYLEEFLEIDYAVGLNFAATWLRGRPRFTATFLEEFLTRKLKSYEVKGTRIQFRQSSEAILAKALNCYKNESTTRPKHDTKGVGISGQSIPSIFSNMYIATRNKPFAYLDTLKNAAEKAAIEGSYFLFENDHLEFLEDGFTSIIVSHSNLHSSVQSSQFVTTIYEPLVVQTAINFFQLEEAGYFRKLKVNYTFSKQGTFSRKRKNAPTKMKPLKLSASDNGPVDWSWLEKQDSAEKKCPKAGDFHGMQIPTQRHKVIVNTGGKSSSFKLSDEESDDDGNENSYIEEILIKESYDDQICDKDSYESNTQEAESNCEEESFDDDISPHFRQNECEPSSWEEYIA